MTQLEYAKKNTPSALMRKIAIAEDIALDKLIKLISEGKIVIPANVNHKLKIPCAIGNSLRTKINANIGTSTEKSTVHSELSKLKIAVKYGADTIMDLSVGNAIGRTRRQILKESAVPVGTVPIYEVAVNAQTQKGNFLEFDFKDILDTLEIQAKDGIDFFTIHSGVTKKTVQVLKENKRVLDIVSRGGAIIAGWMENHKKENPFYEYFDKILDVAYKYDVTLSLGDGMRPGSVLDATDKAQISELRMLGNLAGRAKKRSVQVMIEGPGHVPLNQIEKNIKMQKSICHGAPFYVLGPLVTDVAAGYDHICASIGGAMAAGFGADFLCYVTPAEHLRHPSPDDVKEGVIASKIAAHAGDIAKGIKNALNWDKKMSVARQKRDWKEQINLSLDPVKAKLYRTSSKPHIPDVCTMCGSYCAIKVSESCLRK